VAHIEKRSERRYRVRYRDPAGAERSKTFARLTEARRFKATIEDELGRNLWIDPRAARMTFEEFTTTLGQRRLHVRPATTERVASFMRSQVLPTFGSMPLNKITRPSVQMWVDEIASELAPRTVRDSYRILAGLLREAVRQGVIRQSPCYLISLPHQSRAEPRYLNAEEVERLAEAIDRRYHSLIYAGAYLGLRWSELAGVKRTSLDLSGERLFVVGALQRFGHDWAYTDQLKTTRSRRSLALAPFLVELLSEHLLDAPKSDFVFSSPQGEIIRYGNFRRRFWDPAVIRSGLEHVTPHALRHTCVALMIAEGANPLMVQRQLGHADLRMTLGTYGHLFPHWDDEVADRMQRLWQRTKPGRPAACTRPEDHELRSEFARHGL
jgi:integrase